MNNKYKSQFDDLKEKINSYQNINQRLTEHVKTLDNRLTNSKYKITTLNKTLLDKDKEIASLKNDLSKFDEENFNSEMNKLENLRKRNIDLKKEVERKNKKIIYLEKTNNENELLIDEYYKENQLFKRDNPQSHYIELLNSNIKTLKNMRNQNKILKKELWKYDKNPEYEPIETDRERSFLLKMERHNRRLDRERSIENISNSKGIY